MSAIDPAVLPAAEALLPRFQRREPFRHLVIEDFFPRAFAEQLLDEFPAFERGNARNEAGELGGKSTVERIRELGPAFVALDDLVRSQDFLDWLSTATGIPDLLYDPWYFGGGTHENRHGQDLDPHVDFNRHPENRWHRRLNLIVYLNHAWEDAWGGSLELHTDPRANDNRITLVTPLFNRCVVFETTEWSWHGFSRIELPEAQRALSRKSIALYFYTRERPAEELGPTHSTIYVDRPLPHHLRAGHVLSEDDLETIRALLTRRDMHNQRLYGELTRLQSLLADGGGESSLAGHARRLWGGVRSLHRRWQVEKQPLDLLSVKQAMLPFAIRLPRVARQPLRALWRSLPVRSVAPEGAQAPAEVFMTTGLSEAHPTFFLGEVPPRELGTVAATHPGPFAVNSYRLLYFPDSDTIRLDPVPTPEDLDTLYRASSQFTDPHYSSPEQVERMLDYYGNCLEALELMPAAGEACLEVGAGLAWVSRACKRRDPAVRTIAQDVTDECVDQCPWVDDYRVGLLDAVPEHQQFALISMTHVIEHLTDPAAILEELAQRLQPGGKLFVTAPYRPRGWKPDHGLQPWFDYSYLHVPAHISYLSQRWFEQVSQRIGLRILRWDGRQDDHQAFEAVLMKPLTGGKHAPASQVAGKV
jgi:Rps23 Pro-64 3,4-dihydroxylase Tpa1-like proline 4-hydroxylase/SAM-dependent methyltransferase